MDTKSRLVRLEQARPPELDPVEGRTRVMTRLDGIRDRLGDIEPTPQEIEQIQQQGRLYLQELRRKGR